MMWQYTCMVNQLVKCSTFDLWLIYYGNGVKTFGSARNKTLKNNVIIFFLANSGLKVVIVF